MAQMDSHFKKVIASNASAVYLIDDGYRRLEVSRSYILDQTLEDTAYAIRIQLLAESLAHSRKQKETF